MGFMGMYFVMGVLFLFMMWREAGHGPADADAHESEAPPSTKILPEGAGA